MIPLILHREPKQFSSPKNLREIIPYPLVSVNCNSTCTHLSVVTGNDHGPTLHIVEMEGHQKISYSMNTGLGSDYTPGGEMSESIRICM